MKGRQTLTSSNSLNASNRKLSAAASVVAQTLSRAEGSRNPNPFIQARVENSVNPKTGKPALIAIFPSAKGEIPNRNDVSFLLNFPNLKPMFLDAFLMAGATRAPSSRSEMFRTIRRGFLAYLRDSKLAHILPGDIGDEVLVGFREWLLRPSSGKPLHPKTVGKALGVVRICLEAIEGGQWVAEARRIAERVPFGIVGVNKRLQPTEVLSLDSLLQIMHSAEKEVLEIQGRWGRGRQLIAEGREGLASPSRQLQHTMNDYADLAICLAEIDTMFSNIVPDLGSIARENKRLANAIEHIHTQRKVRSFFQPTPRDLVPFVILLGFVA